MDALGEVGGIKEAFVTFIWIIFNVYNYKRNDFKVLKEYKNQLRKF